MSTPRFAALHGGVGPAHALSPVLMEGRAVSVLQVVIMVVDSTDVQRLHLSKKELHTMMDHEVPPRPPAQQLHTSPPVAPRPQPAQ